MSAFSALAANAMAALLSVFGEPLTYQPESGEPFSATGILTRLTEQEQEQDGVYLILTLAVADLAIPPARGDRATIQGVEYTVWKTLKDDGGGYNLGLRKV